MMMMTMKPNNEEHTPTSTPITQTKNDKDNAVDTVKKHITKSNQTSSLLPFPSTTTPSQSSSSLSSLATVTTSSLSPPPPSLSSSLPDISNNSAPEVGSLFTYDPQILKPFMGLHNVDRPDDPWHHKAYNLYQPLYTGGGTFDQHIKTQRYKRDRKASSALSTFSQNPNILTPEILEHLLRIKSNFKKRYPALYNSMMNRLNKGKTTISITPPEVPQYVSHKNLELAAAEINPLESLIDDEGLQKVMETEKRTQQMPQDSVINSYKNDFILWGNSKADATTSITPEILSEDPQNTLQAVGDKLSITEAPQSFWENSQETLKALKELQLLLENFQGHSIPKDESQSFWEDSQESLNTLNEQPTLKAHENNSQDIAIKAKNLWQTIPEQFVSDTPGESQKIQTSTNDETNLWEPHASLQKRNSFWAELEASEERKEHKQQRNNFDDTEPIFDFDEDFN